MTVIRARALGTRFSGPGGDCFRFEPELLGRPSQADREDERETEQGALSFDEAWI